MENSQEIHTVLQPVTPDGNDAADWQNDPAAVAELKQSIEDAGKPVNPEKLLDQLLRPMEVTNEQAEKFSDPVWAYENLIIEGHIAVIAAVANGGKTTVMEGLCPILIQRGYKVTYINADISPTDVKAKVPWAKEIGIRLLLPDIAEGGSGMVGAIEAMKSLIDNRVNLSKQIFIIDTLKKAASPMQKNSVAPFFALCRAVQGLGATIVLLAHTNKYPDSDGKPIFEGVGDVRNDTDDLIYLVPDKNDDGTLTISTLPDKMRGAFKAITFNIDENRNFTLANSYVDLAKNKSSSDLYEKDRETIELIHDALEGGPVSTNQLAKEVGMGRKPLSLTMKRWKGKQWTCSKGGEKNSTMWQSMLPLKRYPDGIVETEASDYLPYIVGDGSNGAGGATT